MLAGGYTAPQCFTVPGRQLEGQRPTFGRVPLDKPELEGRPFFTIPKKNIAGFA